MNIPHIKISDYTYNLPEEKIAKYPIDSRDNSNLLVFNDNYISHTKFSNLPDLLPSDSVIVFNNSKVVPARLFFRKQTGAHIEVFCIEPYNPSEYTTSFSTKNCCSWIVKVGNAKRWNNDVIYLDSLGDKKLEEIDLQASLVEKRGDEFIVEFHWKSNKTFSEVMDVCGKVPIPPYLKRESEVVDKERYQTIYAQNDGSVAAPTAGLHFSDSVLEGLKDRGIVSEQIVLHVGAGTFIPVKKELISDHNMHAETFSVSLDMLSNLLLYKQQHKRITAVGTTSVRTIESIYWLGLKCIDKGYADIVNQWEPYESTRNITMEDSLKALITWMKNKNLNNISCKTEIIIVPGYSFKAVDILITNFHQPNSTLLLLIAAFTGNYWKDIYNYALNNSFRFLSYGDSSLLFRNVVKP